LFFSSQIGTALVYSFNENEKNEKSEKKKNPRSVIMKKKRKEEGIILDDVHLAK
jgi:hypothetical protein